MAVGKSVIQVLKDFVDINNFNHEPDPGAQDWFDIAMHFLKTSENDAALEKNGAEEAKLYRLKSFDLCVAWDNILKVSTGRGLKHYVDERFSQLGRKVFPPQWPPEAEPGDKDWAWLVQDRASTNITPFCFLVSHHGCMLSYFSDPNHDPWNECKNSGQHMGFQDAFKAMTILANTFFGPFDSAAFHSKSIDAAAAYKSRSNAQDPIFQFFLPRIAADTSETHRLHDPDYAEEVWSEMGNGRDILCKGPRMAMCRFHSIHAVHKHMRPIRHKRLVMWLFLGIVHGYIKNLNSCFMVEPLKLDREDKKVDATQKAMKTQQTESVTKQRSDAKNTLHFSTRILLNTTWMRKDDIFFCITEPVQIAQGMQAKENKGEVAALEYSLTMARGGGMKVLLDVVKRLTDGPSLIYMGFKLSMAEIGSASVMTPEQQFFHLREEREWLELAVGLAFSLVGARAVSMHADCGAFPGKAVLLLSDSAVEVKEQLSFWKDFKKDWLEITSRPEPGVARMAARSWANIPVFHNFMENLSFHRFRTIPDHIKKNLLTCNSIRATLVLENMIKTVRAVEKRCQENKRIGLLRRWLTPVQRNVGKNVFRYSSIDYKRTVLKGGHLKRKIPHNFFQPPRRKDRTSLDFSGIVGTNRVPKWVTFSAETQKAQYADMAVLRQCCRTGEWGKVPQAWLCHAVPTGTLFRRKDGRGLWYFSLTLQGQTAVLAWPAKETFNNGI